MVTVRYLTELPDFSGFNAPDSARQIAQSMYESGVDIVYHAAGGSGAGLFEAAKSYSEDSGSKVWAIGVDSDQYINSDASVQGNILTSMLKRVDVAVYETIQNHNDGTFQSGGVMHNLSNDGVGYATSGGFVDDIAGELDALKAKVVSNQIMVPDGTDSPEDESSTDMDAEEGVIIRIGLEAEMDGFNPTVNNFAASAYNLATAVFEPLVTLKNGFDFSPGLAESWTASDDYMVWDFKIREGIKFHDGTDLNAGVVLHAFQTQYNNPLIWTLDKLQTLMV